MDVVFAPTILTNVKDASIKMIDNRTTLLYTLAGSACKRICDDGSYENYGSLI